MASAGPLSIRRFPPIKREIGKLLLRPNAFSAQMPGITATIGRPLNPRQNFLGCQVLADWMVRFRGNALVQHHLSSPAGGPPRGLLAGRSVGWPQMCSQTGQLPRLV